jgi:hypothetical protein
VAEYGTSLLAWTGWLTQFVFAFTGFVLILRVTVVRRGRWRMNWRDWRRMQAPPWLIRLYRTDRESVVLQERRVLLSGCGWRTDPRLYLTFRRLVISICILLALGCAGFHSMGWIGTRFLWNGLMMSVLPGGAALFDDSALQALRRYRADRIRLELASVSSQLLYYSGSKLHLHGKLLKCVPLVRVIRGDLGYMLNEWYHDPDRALHRFKERLGTNEAYGFAESLRSLRLHESAEVYDLLREMVREYKAKMELAKDSRKETASYGLFILAGTPILYTFQIFLYPWVQEASKLFDALNP